MAQKVEDKKWADVAKAEWKERKKGRKKAQLPWSGCFTQADSLSFSLSGDRGSKSDSR